MRDPGDAVRRKERGNGGERVERWKREGGVLRDWGLEDPHTTGSEDADVQQLLQLLPLLLCLHAATCLSS